MEQVSYKDSLSPIDFTRNLEQIDFFDFQGLDEQKIADFRQDIEADNDSIELHLVRNKAYKEALILSLPKSEHPTLWEKFFREEQKTFGGSKIFYINSGCTRVLILSVKNEVLNKLNMVITRINKVNEKIHRYNSAIKKENLEAFETKMKGKADLGKKDEIIHFIQQNLRI